MVRRLFTAWPPAAGLQIEAVDRLFRLRLRRVYDLVVSADLVGRDASGALHVFEFDTGTRASAGASQIMIDRLDVAGVAIQVIDPDQKTALINKKFREMLGYQENEGIGRNWFDIFTPERNRGLAKALFGKLVAGKIALDKCHESPVLAKSGEERIIAWYNPPCSGMMPAR